MMIFYASMLLVRLEPFQVLKYGKFSSQPYKGSYKQGWKNWFLLMIWVFYTFLTDILKTHETCNFIAWWQTEYYFTGLFYV